MHRSTDGSPAYSERRASAWQYWQSIWYLPAWTRWLKKIGWRGAPGTLTIGRAAAGAYTGVARVRREAITAPIRAAARDPSEARTPMHRPLAGPPCPSTLATEPSGGGVTTPPCA